MCLSSRGDVRSAICSTASVIRKLVFGLRRLDAPFSNQTLAAQQLAIKLNAVKLAHSKVLTPPIQEMIIQWPELILYVLILELRVVAFMPRVARRAIGVPPVCSSARQDSGLFQPTYLIVEVLSLAQIRTAPMLAPPVRDVTDCGSLISARRHSRVTSSPATSRPHARSPFLAAHVARPGYASSKARTSGAICSDRVARSLVVIDDECGPGAKRPRDVA